MGFGMTNCDSDLGSISQGTGGQAESALSAASLKITRIASVPILKGDALKADSSTHVSLADASLTATDATVIGFADDDTPMGANVTITIMGVLSDPIFSVFSVNDQLYLDETGAITNIRRLTGFHVVVGYSLGSSEIFVRTAAPIALS